MPEAKCPRCGGPAMKLLFTSSYPCDCPERKPSKPSDQIQVEYDFSAFGNFDDPAVTSQLWITARKPAAR